MPPQKGRMVYTVFTSVTMTLVKWKMVYDKRGYRVKHVTFIAAPPVMEMELNSDIDNNS